MSESAARRLDIPQRGNRIPYGWRLAAILGTGFFVRLFIVVAIPTQPVSDFLGYFRSAQSLAQEGRYDSTAGVPYAGHPPGYPILLSLALRLAPAGEHLLAAKLTNLFLAVLAGWIGATLARRFWGETAGLWTAAWISFLPRSLLMTGLIASENLFAPLLLLFLLLCAISWTRGPSLPRAAAIGLVVGLLCLTRSVAYLLPLVWLVGAVVARRPRRALAAEILLILAVEHVVLLPWAIRNAREVGKFTFLNTVGGVGLFIGNNPNATGGWYPWAGDLERLRPGSHARGTAALDEAARQEAWRWIRENPGHAARLYLRKLRIILTDDSFAAEFAIFAESIWPPSPPGPVLRGPHPLKSHPRLVRRVLRISGLLLAAAAIGGFLWLLRGARRGSLTDRTLAAGLLAAALYVPLFSAVIAVNGRYRWPAEDAVMPLAGLCLSRMKKGARREAAPPP